MKKPNLRTSVPYRGKSRKRQKLDNLTQGNNHDFENNQIDVPAYFPLEEMIDTEEYRKLWRELEGSFLRGVIRGP